MRLPQILLLLIIVVCVKSQLFGDCMNNEDCPANAACEMEGSGIGDCECFEGFYPYDTEVSVDGDPVVICTQIPMAMTTTRRTGYGGILAVAAGAGLLALVILGGGAAVLASSSG